MGIGLLVIFVCGMPLSWSILEYDMAIWKQMMGLTYAENILHISSWYIGAIAGSFFGGLLVLNLGKKFIYVSCLIPVW